MELGQSSEHLLIAAGSHLQRLQLLPGSFPSVVLMDPRSLAVS